MLPTTRNTTYGTDSPVLPADLNDLQDMIVGDKRPPGTRWVTASQPSLPGSGDSFTAPDQFQFGASGSMQGMACGQWQAGDHITAFSVRMKAGTTSGSITMSLYSNKGDGSPTVIGTVTVANSTAWATYTQTLGTGHTLVDGESLYLSQASGDGLAHLISLIGITSDRL